MIKKIKIGASATKLKLDKEGEGIVVTGSNTQMNTFRFTEAAASVELCKKVDAAIHSCADVVKYRKKEYFIFHESNIVAVK